ncbi:ANTAR domain-containing protein [Arthrobacter cheniae]|uniref:ANTAR domain-containing protein n=1 Tax=Arthrobacter cheniae TaxID=1258888 RepID=UPI001601B51C|nr:ANTAR domain-containing protein [Arthrobacter cheniae]
MALTEVTPTLGNCDNCLTGTFRYHFESQEFLWSEEIYQIHGYTRGEVVPSYQLGYTHIAPEMRDQAQAFWDDVSARGAPVSSYLILQDVKGRNHQVLVTGDRYTQNGVTAGVWGMLIDLTHSVHADSHRLANEAVAAVAETRGVIEQAKGILMSQTGINADDAFELIKQHSQDTNRKVNIIARDIVDQARGLHDGTDDGADDVAEDAQARHLARRIIRSI